MIVSSLYLEHFTTHLSTSLVFPKTGSVLVSGSNGQGKSSIIEGVAWGVFGKSLRGTRPCKDGKVAVRLHDPSIMIERSARNERTKLLWSRGADEPKLNTTVTKAQDEIETLTGSFELWRRTHVFSLRDAAHYTQATDSARRYLLEEMLGLGRFDAAHAACITDRKRAEQNHRVNEQNVSTSQVRVEERKAALARFDTEVMPGLPTEERLVKELEDAKHKLSAFPNVPVLTAHSELADARGVIREADALFATVERERTTLNSMDRDRLCPQCNGKIGLKQVQDQTTRLVAVTAQVEAMTVRVDHAKVVLQSQMDSAVLVRERDALRAELVAEVRGAEVALTMLRVELRNRGARRLEREEAATSLVGAQRALTLAQSEALESKLELDRLNACEQVLGLRGVRARMLGGALAGIEHEANAWLAAICGKPLKLHLRPYSENASGGVKEALSLEVEGAGGGDGYKGASGGEGRRIDVALLLALSNVAAAAHGRQPGTLFVDELFDALDASGVERVCTMLKRLAQTRCVVVITHRPDEVAEHMKGSIAARWHVTEGAVKVT